MRWIVYIAYCWIPWTENLWLIYLMKCEKARDSIRCLCVCIIALSTFYLLSTSFLSSSSSFEHTQILKEVTHTHTPEVYLYIRGVEVRIVSLVVGWWNDELWLEKTMLVIKPNWKWMSHTFYGWVSFPNVFLHVCVCVCGRSVKSERTCYIFDKCSPLILYVFLIRRSLGARAVYSYNRQQWSSLKRHIHTHTRVECIEFGAKNLVVENVFVCIRFLSTNANLIARK